MFLPLGDDVDNRTIPIAGTFLVLANLIVYAFMTRLWLDNPQTGADWLKFVKEWGLLPLELYRGKYELLLTSMFMHGDIFHFLGNMIVLWAFVRTLENSLGAVTFVGFYLFWGCVAGYAQCAMDWNSKVPIIGASGAIAGVMGAYFVTFGARSRIKTLIFIVGRPTIVPIPAGVFAFFWVFSQLAGYAEEGRTGGTGVAWIAHFGGFAAGAVTLLLVGKHTPKKLVRDKEGNLVFRDVNEVAPAPTVAQFTPPAHDNLGNACPHCATQFEEKDKLSDTLAKCPNAQCGRLILLS